jgi:uncharacterized protein YrzB (UPF0473 family)
VTQHQNETAASATVDHEGHEIAFRGLLASAAALPRERVVIVPCGGKKQDKIDVCPAGEMYVGSY